MVRQAYDWMFFESGAPEAPGKALSPLLREWGNLEERERALSIEPGRPFLLRPDFSPDLDILDYFASFRFHNLAPLSRSSYARSLRNLLSYLESQGIDWRAMRATDLFGYDHWRRRDERNSDRRISGATFARELAAFQHFFKWAFEEGVTTLSPDALRGIRPTNASSQDIKWLTTETYELWRNVGLRGYGADGLPDPSFRGRNKTRNVAYAELLWRSGLRLREAGTLLLQEVPSRPQPGRYFAASRVGEAVAKGRGRKFWIERAGLAAIEGYTRTTRAASVARAQTKRRYNNLTRLMIIERITKRGHVFYRDENGGEGTVSLDNLDADARRRVFVEGPRGLEPAMLWLTESGMPMKYNSWQMVFYEADQHCARRGVPEIFCYPHMLRHSFALRLLVISLYLLDHRFNITPEQREYYRRQFGDGYAFVQSLLGHRSSETTREIYLEPAKHIPVDLFVPGEAKIRSPQELMDIIVEGSSQVLGVPA